MALMARGGGEMRRFGGVALLLALGALTATTALARPVPAPSAGRCGGTLWRLKTLSDAGRKFVLLTAKTTTVGALAARTAPKTVSARRRTSFQRQAWEVVAQVVEYRLDGSDLRLVLYDDGAYINAVLPAPSCLPKTTRNRSAIIEARNTFIEKCGRPSSTRQPLGAVAYIRGIGLWGGKRTERGAAPNGAELYPVTGFRPIAGCGS
jgi:hypothetical protein